LNIYQTPDDTSALILPTDNVKAYGFTLLLFDGIKLALYTLYFGK
jgi:hypothetical protein